MPSASTRSAETARKPVGCCTGLRHREILTLPGCLRSFEILLGRDLMRPSGQAFSDGSPVHYPRRFMIPYVEHPTLEIGPYTLTAFRVLVLAAIVTQFQIVKRRAPRFGIGRDDSTTLIAWAILLGLIGAHVFDVLAYFPERLREDPLELFRVWGSLSSTGGMAGGLLGLYVVARRRGLSREQLLSFFDCCMFALPFTLALGRLGCGLQHDHPGVVSDHFLAVAFPDGGRFDLGLLEFFMVSGVGAIFLVLDRRPQPAGFYAGLFFALYGPGRFALDFLRTGDARYAGFTPAQFLMAGATVAGAGVLLWALRNRAPSPD